MNTPWWGAALVGGIFALGGVFLSQVVTIRLERIRGKREDERRWHADRRHLYASMLSAATSLIWLIERQREDKPSWVDFDEHIHEFHVKGQEVMLIGSKSVRVAATNLRTALIDIRKAFEESSATARDELIKQTRDAGNIFVSAARKELGTEE